MITIQGYEIAELIYTSSKTLVYRGHRVDNQLAVVLKLLRVEYPTPEELAGYRHEYELIRSLDQPGAIKAYGLQKQGHTLAMILEDFGGASLERLVPDTLEPEEFLALAIRVAQAVGALHYRNVIHKALTPANILWNPTTGQIKIIDFGLATIFSREHPSIRRPESIEGDLAYISPEQTGRMNRSVDYRTDFYTLGVTFYQLLTGQVPFETDDPIELVYAHIAKAPPLPNSVNPAVPPAIAAIVMKLLAKTAEERYQSAEGLCADLEACVRQLRQAGQIESFALGQYDASDRLHIPEKLYGRNAEIAHLRAIFDRVAQGQANVVFCMGESGVGKSLLLRELYRPTVEQQGYFIVGKYDQFKHNLPYTGLAQAFHHFIDQILTESEASLRRWKTALLQAVGNNGQVLIDLVPKLELVIGAQPAAQPLPALEAQNRFQYVFQSFVRAILQRQHPLVLVLDDLQWADQASLSLLTLLAAAADLQHLLVIAACRDVEVAAGHPLLLAVEAIKRSQTTVSTLRLGSLAFTDVERLIADALRCATADVRALATLVHEKTRGNAFFVTQFLQSLHEERLITFNSAHARWQWDTEQIRAREVTDNVVALVAGKLQKLAPATQQAVRIAACIGSQFDLQTLAHICQRPLGETWGQLRPALSEGMILSLDDRYKLASGSGEEPVVVQSQFKFLHDRVQHAAYSLIHEADKPAIHLSIGRLLLATSPAYATGTQLFDTIDHVNRGLELIADPDERVRVAALNLKAGQQAKAAAAYETALRYLGSGMRLLSAESWDSAYQLCFDIHIEWAECAYLLGNVEQAEALFDLTLCRATSAREQARIFNLRVILSNNQARLREAVVYGTQGLALVGVHFPESAEGKKAAVAQASVAIQSRLDEMAIEDLVNLPRLNAPEKSQVMELCTNMLPPVYMSGDIDLYTLLILTMVEQSLFLGNSDLSSHAYIMYGVLINIGTANFSAAYSFGEVGLRLGQEYQIAAIDAKNYFAFATWLNHWRQHLKTNASYFQSAYSRGLEAGDMTFAAYAVTNHLLTEVHCGAPLEHVYREAITYRSFIARSNDHASSTALSFCMQFVLCLQGKTRHRYRFDDEQYDEDAQVAELQKHRSLTVLGNYWIYKLLILYLYEDYGAALEAVRSTPPRTGGGTFLSIAFLFYDTLTRIAIYPSLSPEEQRVARSLLSDQQKLLQTWSEQSPVNYRQAYLLSSAELARIEGRDLEAMSLYDQAVEAAHANDYLHHEALANELAARFYMAQGRAKIAALYITEAHYLYGRWGARGKVEALEQAYPHWLAGATERAYTRATPSTQEVASVKLDLASVLKASQAISSEIDFNRLLARLMRIAIQNAGAERGYLIIYADDRPNVEVEGSADDQDIHIRHTIGRDAAQQPSSSIINYVARTHDAVVLGDAAVAGTFAVDRALQERGPKSILCVPILHTGKLTGVLYLENNLVTDAFTQNSLDVLTLLAAQMAISIENARLYANMEAQTEQIKAANVRLQHEMSERKRLEKQLVQAQKMEAVGRLAGGVAHDFNNLLTVILGYTEIILVDLDEVAPLRPEIKAIEAAGERAAGLTRQLLAFSRQQVLQPELLDLNAIVVRLTTLLRRLIGEDVEMTTLLAPDPTLIQADPTQVEQIVLNLALNARDAMPDGGKLSLETTVVDMTAAAAPLPLEAKAGRYVLLSVKDTGHGMDSETQSRIFEPFFTSKEVGKGTGLGLAMVHGIVYQTGGYIEVSSAVNQGSTFNVYLPQAATPVIKTYAQARRETALRGSGTILIVEDEASVRALACRILRNYGYTILEAQDGVAAQEIAQQYTDPIDLVIADVIMPGGVSGVRLAESLLARRPQMKVLYISGYTDNAIVQHGVLEPGRAFLQKPFTARTLVRKVQAVLHASRETPAAR